MWLFVLLLLIVALILMPLYKSFAIAREILDKPNHRSSHGLPTPKGGGIIFACMWLIVLYGAFRYAQLPLNQFSVLFSGGLLVLLMGYVDDLRNLAIRWRLIIQFLVAGLSVILMNGVSSLSLGYLLLPLGVLGSMLAIIAIVWSINLYNFMDGIDGLATIEAIFVFGFGSFLLWLSGGGVLAWLGMLLVAFMLVFLIWNWPPAKVFMGDAGSSFLGFLVLAFALIGEKFYGLPALIWLILYAGFFFDATITLLRRMKAGERWWQAHRAHAFQRIYWMGWPPYKILLWMMFINTVLCLFALIAFLYAWTLAIVLMLSFIFLAILYCQVERMQPMLFSRIKANK